MKILALILVVSLAALPTRAERMVLTGATVFPVSSSPIENGEVIVDEGAIVHVGTAGSADRAGATVVDLRGHHLYPGLIASTSSLGLTEIASVRATMDVNEMGEHNARLHAYRSVDPDSELIPVARSNGITHANVVPGGRHVRGNAGLLALDGWTWEERMVGGPTGLHMNWPSVRLRHGGDAPPVEKQIAEREEAVQELADLLYRARAYRRARAAAGERGAGHTERNLEFEAWGPVLDREVPLYVHADDARQIESALDFAAAQELRLVIVGGRDAHRVADRLAEAEVGVILERVMARPARDFEGVHSGFERARRLHEAGVVAAISVGSGGWFDSIARNLPFHAGMARAHGLPDGAALASVTLNPARILGVDDRMGSIEVGKRAHLIATTGDVLEIREPVARMWIDGHEVDLTDRHDRLYERYRDRPAPADD